MCLCFLSSVGQESNINSLKNQTNTDVIVVLAPKYSGSVNIASWLVYDPVSAVVFNIELFTLFRDQPITEMSARRSKC